MGIRTRIGRALHRLAVRAEGSGWSMTIGGMELLRNGLRRQSKTGKTVTVDTALQVTVVLAVVQRIAFGVAQVPWKVFRARSAGGKDEARDHALWRVLHRKPNDWQTSFAFRVTMMFHLLLTGDFFAFINRVRNRQSSKLEIAELIPFDPGSITVERRPGSYELRYKAKGLDGQQQEIPPEAMWHVRGPSWNSWRGLKPIELAREAIGLAMAAEETQGDLQKRGLRIPGVLAMEGNVSSEQYDNLAKWVREQAQKDIEETGVMIVDRAAKFTSVMMTAAAAQTLETRRHQVEEICRHWGLMPVMIGHPADMAARAAMEQIFIAHVVHTLDPWMVCIEQAAEAFLLREDEQDISVAFIRAGLMRGDLKSQGEFFGKMMGQGSTGPGQAAFTPNDVRGFLEMNPVLGGDALSQGPVKDVALPLRKDDQSEPPDEQEDDQ